MEKHALPGQPITAVDAGSPAEQNGIKAEDRLMKINGEPVYDVIDYEYLTAAERLTLTVTDANGTERELTVEKEDYEPLGLTFATSLMDGVRTCKNRCVFCFVDQMPKGVRTSLSFKDDDWRLSFIMGNYVTLTNLSDAEFSRMLKRRVSPLYVSVHATEPELRVRIMANPTAARIMERLTALRDHGIRFHAQVVLCPGLNDEAHLERTISDLMSLAPAAQTLAVVPVGVTRFREGLTKLYTFTREGADHVIDTVEKIQRDAMKKHGTRFVFLSDEWYLLAGRALPAYDSYEDFPQIENGVGLIRLFEGEMNEALEDQKKRVSPVRYSFAGGEAATPTMTRMIQKLEPYGVSFDTFAIKNDFFGGNVSVAGLVTGRDLVSQLKGRIKTDTLLIPHCMLREKEDVFLDDMSLNEAEQALNVKIFPVYGGEDLVQKVF